MQQDKKYDANSDFFDKLRHDFCVEEFTGNIGALFDDSADEEEMLSAMEFLSEIYTIAVGCLESRP